MCGNTQSRAKQEENIALREAEKEEFKHLMMDKEDSDFFTAARKSHGKSDYVYITSPGNYFDYVMVKRNDEKHLKSLLNTRFYKSTKIPFSQSLLEVYSDVPTSSGKNSKNKEKCKFMIFESEITLGEKLTKNTMNGANINKLIHKQDIDTINTIFEKSPKESPTPRKDSSSSALYKDPDFPPKTKSIIQSKYYNEEKRPVITSQMDQRLILALRYVDSFSWESPLNSKIPFKIFDDKPLVNSIHQGLFMNDYFLAALGALACHDYRLAKKLVSAGGKENIEYVGFSFNRMGRWECVWVDSFLPFFKKEYHYKSRHDLVYFKTKFLGAQCKEDELWVALYEKAYAKFMGSYFNIAYGGVAAHVMTDLTGAPSITKKIVDYENLDEIWYELATCYQLGYLICCDSGTSENAIKQYPEWYKDFKEKREGKGEKVNRRYFMKKGMGLVDLHTYSIMGLAVVKGEKLVKLRNVWGRTEWLGKWGDGSKEWLDQMAQGISHNHENDGIFFIPFEDFVKLFEKIHFCFYEDENVFSNIQLDIGREGSMYCFDLEIEKSGLYFISLSQESHQKYDLEHTKSEVNYAPLTLIITQNNGIYNNLVGGVKETDRDVWVKAQLSSGTYRVFVIYFFLNFKQARAEFSKIHPNYLIGLTSYGPNLAKISLSKSSKMEYGFGYELNKAISTIVYQQEEEVFKNFEGKFAELEYICLKKSSLGFGMLILKNTSFNKIFSAEIKNKTIGNEIIIKK